MNEVRGGGEGGVGGGVGGSGAGLSEQGSEVLGEAFQSIAQSMGHMVDGIRAIETKMELTDQAVRSLAHGLKLQGQRMLRLEQRINVVESSLRPFPSEEQIVEEVKNTDPEEHTVSERKSCPESDVPSSYSGVTSDPSASTVAGTSRSIPRQMTSTTPVRQSASCTMCSQRLQASSKLSFSDRSALGRCLLKAAHEGHPEDVEKLLKAGADVNFLNNSKWTPLHRAATRAHADVVSVLLRKGADIHAKNMYGFTALHMAACSDAKGRCVQMLIDAGSDIHSRNRSGRTPLHSAAERGNVAIVRILLAAGASRTARDADGRIPSDIAKSSAVRRCLGGLY